MPDCRSRIYLEMLEQMCYDMRSDAPRGVARANSEYAVFAALRGSEWQNRRGLAFFGRALNGWPVTFKCPDISSSSQRANKVQEILAAGTDNAICQLERGATKHDDGACDQHPSTHFIVHPYLYDPNGTGDRRVKNESLGDFWPIVKRIMLQRIGPKKEWHPLIFWSNLYKIAGVRGNPEAWLKTSQQESCNRLLLHELQRNEPLAAIFITEKNPPESPDWFEPFKQYLRNENIWTQIQPRKDDSVPEVGVVKLGGFDCTVIIVVRPGRKMKRGERDNLAARIVELLPPQPNSEVKAHDTISDTTRIDLSGPKTVALLPRTTASATNSTLTNSVAGVDALTTDRCPATVIKTERQTGAPPEAMLGRATPAKVTGMPKRMAIAKIRLDFQPPENLIEENVVYFVDKFRLREKVEPVLVYWDGTDYHLYDGFHRLAAAIRVGRRTIQAEILRGTRTDMDAEWRKGLEAIKKENAEWAKTQAELKRN